MDAMARVAVADFSKLICYPSAMRWLGWNPDRAGNVGAMCLAVAIVAVFALVMIYFPSFQQRRANAGFGPDWDCVVQAKGDPVCTKKLGH